MQNLKGPRCPHSIPTNLILSFIHVNYDGKLIIIFYVCCLQPDASYFRVEQPNTGQIILNRSLNYETKIQLKLQLFAFVM